MVTTDVRRDGDTETGAGLRTERESLIWETHDGQCKLESKNDVVATVPDMIAN